MGWLRKFFSWDGWRGSGNRAVVIYKHLLKVGEWQIDLHKIAGVDKIGCYHSHPAWAYRIVLWGGYEEVIVEEDPKGVWTIRNIKIFGFLAHGWVAPEYVHNIYKVKPRTYTLWIRGPKTHKVRLIGKGWGDKETR